jgi:hypothetical protein
MMIDRPKPKQRGLDSWIYSMAIQEEKLKV